MSSEVPSHSCFLYSPGGLVVRKGSLAVGGAGPSLAGLRGEAGCSLGGKSKDSSAEEDDSQPWLPRNSRKVRMNQPLKGE